VSNRHLPARDVFLYDACSCLICLGKLRHSHCRIVGLASAFNAQNQGTYTQIDGEENPGSGSRAGRVVLRIGLGIKELPMGMATTLFACLPDRRRGAFTLPG
jgi:hypothetical protein